LWEDEENAKREKGAYKAEWFKTGVPQGKVTRGEKKLAVEAPRAQGIKLRRLTNRWPEFSSLIGKGRKF